MNIAVSNEQVGDLLVSVSPLSLATSIAEVANLFLSDTHRELLCLPVVDNDLVVGTISRYAIMRIFLKPFGREVHGPRSVEQWMNKNPLLIDANTDVDTASRYVHEHITNPITEDFVITRGGKYLGVGMVLSLLELLDQRAARRNKTLMVVNRNLKSSQTRLIQSEKMASLGQMVAGVAHEINTPLGYVSSNVELVRGFAQQIQDAVVVSHQLVTALQEGGVDDDTLSDLMQAANEQTQMIISDGMLADLDTLFTDTFHGLEQISELVVSLRNFSRTDHANFVSVNINESIESALTIGRNVLKQKAEVERIFADDVMVECVPSQINQVLLNIFTNAAQAIPHFGVIKIITRGHKNFVDIHIRDNGCGMPESVRKKIFDPFFTTKAVGEGTGLGLSISFQIIQQHNGLIDVKSVEGKGTEFVIRLPRKRAVNTSSLANH